MASKPTAVLTPAALAERWGGAVSLGTLSNWRSQGKGPRFFRPAGTRTGKVLYRLEDVESWERENSHHGEGS